MSASDSMTKIEGPSFQGTRSKNRLAGRALHSGLILLRSQVREFTRLPRQEAWSHWALSSSLDTFET
ncbi:hypothetical protein CC2G_007653 [Coprinopsis cinerea AmutBmut pab1-1]|nr:hypothetical protein CC2G_007653 [Coprinopsis cinerea AmutBmut pab1-1]